MNSPLEVAGIKPMLDFFCYDPETMGELGFYEWIESYKDKPMILTVYNLISQTTRDVQVIPNLNWGGNSLLGADVRFEDYTFAHASVYYVEDVQANSPAEKAGIKAQSDYIVGCNEMEFNELDDIGK